MNKTPWYLNNYFSLFNENNNTRKKKAYAKKHNTYISQGSVLHHEQDSKNTIIIDSGPDSEYVHKILHLMQRNGLTTLRELINYLMYQVKIHKESETGEDQILSIEDYLNY